MISFSSASSRRSRLHTRKMITRTTVTRTKILRTFLCMPEQDQNATANTVSVKFADSEVNATDLSKSRRKKLLPRKKARWVHIRNSTRSMNSANGSRGPAALKRLLKATNMDGSVGRTTGALLDDFKGIPPELTIDVTPLILIFTTIKISVLNSNWSRDYNFELTQKLMQILEEPSRLRLVQTSDRPSGFLDLLYFLINLL
jgi:hypothetical protein